MWAEAHAVALGSRAGSKDRRKDAALLEHATVAWPQPHDAAGTFQRVTERPTPCRAGEGLKFDARGCDEAE